MILRGGILDLFPLTSPWPIRIEFLGDEIESLREFDPLTQMSKSEIHTLTAPPAGELGVLKRMVESTTVLPISVSSMHADPSPAEAAVRFLLPSPSLPRKRIGELRLVARADAVVA